MQPELQTNPEIYNKPFPRFGKPVVIGYTGIENLKYARSVKSKKVNFDLNLHIDKAKRKPADRDVKLNDLLYFLVEHETKIEFPHENCFNKCKIFCYRGLMTCVALTPYENRDPWKIVAVFHKGDIYLCARDTEEKQEMLRNLTEQDLKFSSWGYKFEQYVLSDHPNAEPNPDEPVDETKEFSLVLSTSLNRHTIIYAAEMDGVRCKPSSMPPAPAPEEGFVTIVDYLSDKEFVELKTNRHLEFPKQERSFRRFKTKRWWCQSFLVGIDKILCGFRNDEGIVEELKVYPVKELAKMSERFWRPSICFNFLDSFFTYVKGCLAREIQYKHGDAALNNVQSLPMISLLFEWEPGMPIRVSKNYTYEDDPILTDYFLENFGKPEI